MSETELFGRMIGNNKLKSTLAKDIAEGTHSHAYIIEGPEGSGKHTAAMLTCASLFCENKDKGIIPCGKCVSCVKCFENVCTDVITVDKGEKATIVVDVIRDMIKSTLHLAPTEMAYKVYIIEEADKMTVEAQNSLLLALEEPPEYVVFLLLCSDSALLLETVKSRAPIIKTELFDNDKVAEFLKNDERCRPFISDKEKFDYAVTSSSGALGKALTLLTDEDTAGIELRSLAKRTVESLSRSSTTERLEVIHDFPSSRSEIVKVLDFVRTAMRDLLAVKKSDRCKLLFYTDRSEAEKIASKLTVKKIINTEKACANAERDISSNLNISASLTLLAANIK